MTNICIRVILEGEMVSRFTRVKESLGFATNTAVVIHLINDAYRKHNERDAVAEVLVD